MKFREGCWRRRLAVLIIATSWLSGCTTCAFDVGGREACPPVVEYSREFQARAAEELAQLQDGSAVMEMMGGLRCYAGAGPSMFTRGVYTVISGRWNAPMGRNIIKKEETT